MKLLLFYSISVTIATPERSFSTLMRIKTDLRNSNGKNDLNGFWLHLSIHREISINIKEVIAMVSEEKQMISDCKAKNFKGCNFTQFYKNRAVISAPRTTELWSLAFFLGQLG